MRRGDGRPDHVAMTPLPPPHRFLQSNTECAGRPAVIPPPPPGLRVQNLLLGLGTGLLAVAAVVFTAVNWDRLDAGLQAVALLAATACWRP